MPPAQNGEVYKVFRTENVVRIRKEVYSGFIMVSNERQQGVAQLVKNLYWHKKVLGAEAGSNLKELQSYSRL